MSRSVLHNQRCAMFNPDTHSNLSLSLSRQVFMTNTIRNRRTGTIVDLRGRCMFVATLGLRDPAHSASDVQLHPKKNFRLVSVCV